MPLLPKHMASGILQAYYRHEKCHQSNKHRQPRHDWQISSCFEVRVQAAAYLRVVLLEGSNEAGHEVGAHSLAGSQADHPGASQPEILHGLAGLPGHLHQLLAVGQYRLPCLRQQGWP